MRKRNIIRSLVFLGGCFGYYSLAVEVWHSNLSRFSAALTCAVFSLWVFAGLAEILEDILSDFQKEQRERLNPKRLNLVDVMLGKGGIERRNLFTRMRRGAAKWSTWKAVLIGVSCAIAFAFMVYMALIWKAMEKL